MIINEPTKWDTIIPIAMGILVLACIACIPMMISDGNKRRNQAWQEKGCQMYADSQIADVPAKCQQFFVDHYAPQDRRVQP